MVQLPQLQISVLSVPGWAKPKRAPFRYPKYAIDFGIEQDFERYLLSSYGKLTEFHTDASFVYLPIYWTRLHLNNSYAQFGLPELQALVDPYVDQFGSRLLTVCQYDDGPLVDLGEATVYLASRRTPSGRDAPLLASPLPQLRRAPKRTLQYTFAGRLDTHAIRQDLYDAVGDDPRFHFHTTSPLSARKYARHLASSSIVLCPRGYGGSSFRFFEALQVGSIPWLIGEFDTRPFKSLIDWSDYSFYSPSVEEFVETVQDVTKQDVERRLRNVSLGVGRLTELKFGSWGRVLTDDLLADQ